MGEKWIVQFLVNQVSNPGSISVEQTSSSKDGFASLEEAKNYAETVLKSRLFNISGVMIYGTLVAGAYPAYQLTGADSDGNCVWRKIS